MSGSKILVYGVLDRALCVADPFLDLALGILRRALSLELSVACRFADAFLDLSSRLVGKAGDFVTGTTHFHHLGDERPAPLQSTNQRADWLFRHARRIGSNAR